MKHINKFLNIFRKPQVTGYLVRGGKGAKVRITKVSLEQAIIILYAVTQRLAAGFGLDQRYILHKVLDLDTAAKKDRKKVEKALRQQVYKNKKK